MLELDNSYYSEEICYIVGTDEAGRGPLCGPVVVAACILPKSFNNELINDSKKLSKKAREKAFNLIVENAIDYQIEVVSAGIIDKINIYEASKLGMKKALEHLRIKPNLILTDCMPFEMEGIEVIPLVKGDAKSKNIAASSILAKVTRDRIMNFYDLLYPEYDLKNNKGYGTKKHMQAIKKFGVIEDFHRLSYAPCQKVQLNLFETESD